MEQELILGKTIEEIDEMILEYMFRFGERPIYFYPQSLYDSKYVYLIMKALEENKPYSENDIRSEFEEMDI